MKASEWKALDEKVNLYKQKNNCTLLYALQKVAPKISRAAYFSARSKVLGVAKAYKRRTTSKVAQKVAGAGFTTFVAQDAATVKVQHPSGCIIECPVSLLGVVLSALKGVEA